MPCSCKVFSPVRWPPAAASWERKQDTQGSLPEVALEGDGTADMRIKSGLLCVRKIRRCAGKCHMSENPFILIGIGISYFQSRWFCTFGQNVATLDCLVRSSYPQLHGIVNLIQILQGGLEIVLLSWRTFPLTDLHWAEHLFIGSTNTNRLC